MQWAKLMKKIQPAVPVVLAVTIQYHLLSKVIEPLLSEGSLFFPQVPKQ